MFCFSSLICFLTGSVCFPVFQRYQRWWTCRVFRPSWTTPCWASWGSECRATAPSPHTRPSRSKSCRRDRAASWSAGVRSEQEEWNKTTYSPVLNMFNTCVTVLCVRQVDEDYAAADYRLQYRRSGSGGSQYEDAYIGRDCEFLVLHLDPHTDYLFRVCARGEGRTEWSPWSVPQTGYTTLAPHGGWSCNQPPIILITDQLFCLILSVNIVWFLSSSETENISSLVSLWNTDRHFIKQTNR